MTPAGLVTPSATTYSAIVAPTIASRALPPEFKIFSRTCVTSGWYATKIARRWSAGRALGVNGQKSEKLRQGAGTYCDASHTSTMIPK